MCLLRHISFEPGFRAHQGLAQKIKSAPFPEFFCLFLQFWVFRGDFKNPRQTPVRTKLRLKRFSILRHVPSFFRLRWQLGTHPLFQYGRVLRVVEAYGTCTVEVDPRAWEGQMSLPCTNNLVAFALVSLLFQRPSRLGVQPGTLQSVPEEKGPCWFCRPFSTIRNALSTAGNSMTSSEKPLSGTISEKRGVPAVLRGWELWKPQMPWIIGLGGSQPYSRGEF